MKTRFSTLGALLFCSSAFLLPARAATYTVTQTSGGGNGSLPRVIDLVNASPGADIITFDPTVFGTPQTLDVVGRLFIFSPVTIIGPGARLLSIDGNNFDRIFETMPGSSTTISGLSLINGASPFEPGGAISNAGTLTLFDCAFRDNHIVAPNGIDDDGSHNATNGLSGRGGAIYSSGSLNVVRCTFSGNSALGGFGGTTEVGVTNGGRGDGGAIYIQSGAATINTSTFSGNTIAGGDGGINSNFGFIGNVGGDTGGAIAVAGGTLKISSSTITNNSVAGGGAGGLGTLGGTTTIANTIIAANVDNGTRPDVQNDGGTITSGGTNLIGNADFLAAGDQAGDFETVIDPKLGALADNGGPTQTVALLSGSPAIDAGKTNLKTDQRGFVRPLGSAPDIGSFEAMGNAAPVISSVTITPQHPLTSSILTATPVASDANNDSISFSFVWKKNGQVIPGETGATLDLSKPGNGDDGDIITVTVIASDGNGFSKAVTSAPVTIGNLAPIVSVSPQGATDKVGDKRTFVVTASDPNGAGDISELWLLINEQLDWSGGATLVFNQNSGLLFLRSGDTFLPGIKIGSTAGTRDILDNGAIRVVGREVSLAANPDGQTLSLSVPATIRNGLVGQNTLFGRVQDAAGAVDAASLPNEFGFVRSGSYTVQPQFAGTTNSAPTVSMLSPKATITVLPLSGVATIAQRFIFFAKDDNGAGDIQSMSFLAGTQTDVAHSANIVFDPRTRRLYLRSDDGSTLLGGIPIGTPGVLENSQVRLDVSKAQLLIYPDGKSLGLRLPMQAKTGLIGQNKIWLRVQDRGGALAVGGDAQGYVASGT